MKKIFFLFSIGFIAIVSCKDPRKTVDQTTREPNAEKTVNTMQRSESDTANMSNESADTTAAANGKDTTATDRNPASPGSPTGR